MDADALQDLLNKYPNFVWSGSLGRRQRGELHFVLGKGAALGLSSNDAAPFVFRSRPDDLAHALRRFLCERLGEAVALGYDVGDMAADIRRLDAGAER